MVLPEPERLNILMKKDKPEFKNWWRVYGLGLDGVLEGAIYPNWEYGDFDNTLPYGYGQDFGFNDPDTLIKVAIDHKNFRIYVDECIYRNGLKPADLRRLMREYVRPRDLIVADCEDARMIAELALDFNIHKAYKYAGSVNEGIKIIQDYKIIVTERSKNIVRELNNYIWADKAGAVPVPGFDHSLDSIRYYVTYILFNQLARRPVMKRAN